MSVTSGRTSRTPLASYVPDESSSRTWLVMSLWGWTPFSGTLPRWGTTQCGELYELPTPALPTVEPESSSLLPTPNTMDQMPPRSDEALARAQEKGGCHNLKDVMPRLLPTPAVNDMGEGKTVEAWDEWTAKMQEKHSNGNGHGPSLAIEAQRLLPTPVADHSRGLPQPGTDFQSLPNVALSLLPTPTVADATSARNSTATRHRLPPTGIHAGNTLTDLLVPLPGEPTSLLSADGSESSDDQHPDLLSQDQAESA